jgi:hypothetical protein
VPVWSLFEILTSPLLLEKRGVVRNGERTLKDNIISKEIVNAAKRQLLFNSQRQQTIPRPLEHHLQAFINWGLDNDSKSRTIKQQFSV